MLRSSTAASVSYLIPTPARRTRHRLVACRAQAGEQPLPPGLTSMGSSILAGPPLLLSPGERTRLDSRPDHLFYSTPRMMHHEHPGFLAATTDLLRQHLPANGRLLELCSSWCSHLPPELPLKEVVGLGMNQQELSANSALTQWLVQDLNACPHLEQLESNYFDAAMVVNGVQYLMDMEVVLAEVLRVLQRGGVLLLVFGSSCWAEKALAGWLARDMEGRTELLLRVLAGCGFTDMHTLRMNASASSVAAAPAAAGPQGKCRPAAVAATSAAAPGLPSPDHKDSSSSSSQVGDSNPEDSWVLHAVIARKPAAAAQWAAGGAAAAAGGGGSAVLVPGMDPAAAAASMLAQYPYLTDLRQHVQGTSSSASSISTTWEAASSSGGPLMPAQQPPVESSSKGDVPQGEQGTLQDCPAPETAGGGSPGLLPGAPPTAAAAPATGPGVLPRPSTAGAAAGPVAAAAAGPVADAVGPPAVVLERWRGAYRALCVDAQDLGIPASALPVLPEGAGAEQIQEATQHVQNMIASFLSAGL